MGIAQAVKQVASDVVDTAKTAASASAKQIAKTPLDLLEELLGQSPGDKKTEKAKPEGEVGSASQVNPEELKQKELADDQYKAQRAEQLRKQINDRSQGYYDQQKVENEHKKQAEMRKEQERSFNIRNLEKQKNEDFALRAAKDASSAEKRVGAG